VVTEDVLLGVLSKKVTGLLVSLQHLSCIFALGFDSVTAIEATCHVKWESLGWPVDVLLGND